MTRKPVVWLGDSRQRIKTFAPVARQRAGHQLARVQDGLEPESWKPMPSVGLGVAEIRVRGEGGAYRVLYVARFSEAVYVLHAFEKKARKTPKPDIELARRRYRALLDERRRT